MRRQFLSLVLVTFLAFLSSCAHNPKSLVTYRDPAAKLPGCNDMISNILQSDFMEVKEGFNAVLRDTYRGRDADSITKNVEALLFIDYNDALPTLYKIYDGDVDLASSSIFRTYDNSGGNPFNNYVKASDYLMENQPEFSADSLKEVHKRMMRGNVDNIPGRRIGTFRTEDIIGNVPRGYEISQTQYKELLDNPYIDVSRMNGNAQRGYTGYIGYPNAQYHTDEVLRIVKRRDSDLHRAIVAFKNGDGGNQEELTGRMINALTEDLMDWFVRQRDQLGEINTVTKFKKYARVVATFQRNLISIHPFYDGNGRSVRQFAMYYPFWLEGLPPPRMLNVDNDLYSSLDSWTDQIVDGVFASHNLYRSMTDRLNAGQWIDNTPELLFPNIPEKALINFKSEKPRKFVKNKTIMDVDSAQFAEFVFTHLSKVDGEFDELMETPKKAMDEWAEEYRDFVKRSYLDYVHAKKGRERVAVELADSDFVNSFANQAYKSTDEWKDKMARHYKEDVVWRGLSRRNQEIEEDEIIGMFTDLHHQFVSNRVMGVMRDSEHAVKEAIKDFDQYNQDVIFGGLEEMAKDHSRTGPMYSRSYGYSTSKDRKVGKAFAMGAMVVADYGQHHDYQHLLKSRVLVGMRQARKDVDLNRLKQVRKAYSNKYPRQQEVMGVGAADPDSITFVQLIDENGDAFLSYVRNPKNPSEILVFDREVSDLNNLPRNPKYRIDLP